MLTGIALRVEATRLDIRGRSKMSADQLRAAILAVTTPVPAPSAPSAPWTSTRGKRKLSARRARYSRRSI